MVAGVADISLVSPLGLGPGEHVFFFRAEVAPHTSGAFTNRDGEALPIHDCPWIPASRPWTSRVRLLAKQALSRVKPASSKTPILLVGPEEAVTGEADLVRFLKLSGHAVRSCRSGAAAFVSALQEAQALLKSEPEVVVLAVDSRVSREEIERWHDTRYSSFTRSPLPPSEGAAAMRLVASGQPALAGKILAIAGARSEATDENDAPADGAALARVLSDLAMPARVPLVVGPRAADPLRARDFHIAAVRHHSRLDGAEMPSLEEKIGSLGSAAGLMSAVFAMAWLRHGLPLPEPFEKTVAVAWARSRNGAVGAVLVGDERS